ncbi:MAG: hypothetical protein OEY19_12460 [Gammaproteobacteria bacterium]|nr:hypothetical protein [Gammaproteobacteria bacterium]MDH5629794.1 hypothetical protein [Gammaproteobacteria bacterium]
MTKAIVVTFLIFAFLFSGIYTLYKTANKFKLPDDYDKDKSGYDDEEDDDWK